MGVAAAALTLVGTAMSVAGARQEGEAAKAAASYNARISVAQAREQAEKVRADAKLVRGENIVRVAKSGVRMEGSALATLTKNAFNADKQALNVLRAGRAAANLFHMEGQSAMTASRYRMASAALSGLGKVGGMYGGGS